VLEGHDRGVNWASFHHSLPLIVSGADDRQVKLWRMNETKAWEVDTLRGHINNVSCALFHPKQELIVSNSEDKSIRVWDMSKRQGVQTFRREHDRFWIIAAHQDSNLLAAGHDGGMLVFKLERERPAYVPLMAGVLFMKDRCVRVFHYASSKDTPVISIRRSASVGSFVARSVQYNEAEGVLLVSFDADGGSYELYHAPLDVNISEVAGGQEAKRGVGSSAVFVARQRFAVLDKSRQILIKNFQNEVTKKCAPTHLTTDTMFAAGAGTLLLRSDERITLYDIQQRKAVAEVTTPAVKYVIWSQDMTHVALVSKHAIVICTRKLKQLCTVHDTIRIKSGAWDGCDTFYFSTLNHIKYCLVNGDHGIIRTLEAPLYLTCAANGKLHCLDREGKVRMVSIDSTECQFKLCLHKKEFDSVVRIMKRSQLSGHAIIAYLQKKGYPQVALHFVLDQQTRFNLAVECGNIDVALQASYALDSQDNWQQLGAEALRQGNYHVVEMAYQRTKDMERLSFLYLIAGNTDKLRKMLKIAEMRTDIMSCFHNSLYLGEIGERIKLLIQAGHLPLAHATAATHGLIEQMGAIATQLEASGLPLPAAIVESPVLVYPSLPTIRDSNWPLLTVSQDTFHRGLGEEDGNSAGVLGLGTTATGLEGDAGAGWADDLDLGPDGPSGLDPFAPSARDACEAGDPGVGGGNISSSSGGANDEQGGVSGGGWGDDLELDLENVFLPCGCAGSNDSGRSYAAPSVGTLQAARWCRESALAADHVAAGSFESAMQLMRRQLGVMAFGALKPTFLALAAASFGAAPVSLAATSLLSPLMRSYGLPRSCIPIPSLVERLKTAYALVTSGQFQDALAAFSQLAAAISVVVVDSRQGVGDLKELLGICREYLTALRLEIQRKRTSEPVRLMELAAYFTHCNLQPSHTMLSLRSAMTAAFKLKLLKSASSFARRLLELNPKPEISTQARKVIQLAEAAPTDAFDYSYDERNPFVLCNAEFVPIYRGSPLLRCTFCKAAFSMSHGRSLCSSCDLGEVGGEASGLEETVCLSSSAGGPE
jgi:coatomer protein complex subunit alpha (xenin)